jgi:hypothetical protein
MVMAHWLRRCSDARAIPLVLVVFKKALQYHLMDALPNAGLHPLMQATPTTHSAAAVAAELLRQLLALASIIVKANFVRVLVN